MADDRWPYKSPVVIVVVPVEKALASSVRTFFLYPTLVVRPSGSRPHRRPADRRVLIRNRRRFIKSSNSLSAHVARPPRAAPTKVRYGIIPPPPRPRQVDSESLRPQRSTRTAFVNYANLVPPPVRQVPYPRPGPSAARPVTDDDRVVIVIKTRNICSVVVVDAVGSSPSSFRTPSVGSDSCLHAHGKRNK